MRKTEKFFKKKIFYLAFGFFWKFFLLFFLFSISQSVFVFGGVGENNFTQVSKLEVGSSAPVIKSILLEDPINLIPNSTKEVVCSIIIEDYQGESDLKNVSAEFFDTSSSFYGDTDDNNNHYTNSSCVLNLSYGDTYTAQANCTFNIEYYANPGNWNCTVQAYDISNLDDVSSNSTYINTLLALGLPDAINYGTLNATFVSLEQIANVTNYGNVQINLTLEGYAQTQGDGKAMNCSLGSIGYIDVGYEKYNLTASTPGDLTLSQFEGNYTNLTSSAVTKRFELNYRQNDITNEAINSTYWRIYVPKGVAGTCTGNIIFGATLASGS